MNYLVAFNIISAKNDKLLNPSDVPVLFYWNEETENDLSKDLVNDENFKNYIDDYCINIKEYSGSHISYLKYNIKTEELTQDTLFVQDVYKLTNISIGKKLALQYLLDIFKYLYHYATKEIYMYDNDKKADIDVLLDIYNILKERNQTKILPETVRNYVRSELQQKYLLHNDNIEYILSQYDEIIN